MVAQLVLHNVNITEADRNPQIVSKPYKSTLAMSPVVIAELTPNMESSNAIESCRSYKFRI